LRAGISDTHTHFLRRIAIVASGEKKPICEIWISGGSRMAGKNGGRSKASQPQKAP
jgi:hypothetical protein